MNFKDMSVILHLNLTSMYEIWLFTQRLAVRHPLHSGFPFACKDIQTQCMDGHSD
jgi:hypothetical protein